MQTIVDSKDLTITMDGLTETTSLLKGFMNLKIKEQVTNNCKKVGLLVQREARRRCPYKEGNLERGISWELTEDGVRIFVPINTAAGRYAEKKHNGTYKLGAGSLAKGPDVGPKYITRAINKNKEKIMMLMQSGLDKI